MSEFLSSFRSSGIAAVLAQLESHSLEEKLTEINKLLITVYREDKNLRGVKDIFEAGEKLSASATRDEELSAYKRLCYNMAANHWRGWDEPGIVLSAEEEKQARQYADKNLELAVQLNKPPAAKFAAHWLVGAFDIAAGDLQAASESFRLAESFVQPGSESQESKMIRAYQQLVGGGEGVEELLCDLVKGEDGEFYVAQIRSTSRVYGIPIQ